MAVRGDLHILVVLNKILRIKKATRKERVAFFVEKQALMTKDAV
jgi:hypothetical protein